MVFGRDIRLSRILNDGKMLCIPMDHGISNGPIRGLEEVHGTTPMNAPLLDSPVSLSTKASSRLCQGHQISYP